MTLIWTNGEVTVYEEQGAVHLRAISGRQDPAELSVDEAEKLIAALRQVVDQIRREDDAA